MNRMLRAALGTITFAVACSTAPQSTDRSSLSRDTNLPIQTDALAYKLAVGDWFWETEIHYTFTNPSSDSVYVVGCRGPQSPYLERLEDGVWLHGWSKLVLDCLDVPTFSVEPNGRYSDTLRIIAAFPDSNVEPKFAFDPPDGVYRLVWKPRSAFDESHPDYGPLLPLEQRISNSFTLTRSN